MNPAYASSLGGGRFDPRWLPLGVTTLGSFMTILDTNIINIALPEILKHFNSSLSNGQLVITAYVMTLAIVVPLSGFLAERVGMKRLYMITVGFFTLGSTLCGLSWNVESLIFFRALQGLGGGMLQPLGMALMFTMITPIERPKFFALLGIPNLLAPLVGPSLGGYIVEYSSWRMIFLINVPVGLLNLVLAIRLLKETPLKSESKLDLRGFAFAALAFPSLLLGMSRGADLGWDSPFVLGLIGVGFTALGAFIYTELRHHDPMLRLRLFSIPTFRLALFVQWIGIFSLFGLNVVIPLFLQRVHGMGPAEAGQVLLPMGFVAFITMNVAGRLYNNLGPKPIVVFGLAVLTVVTFLWSYVHAGTSTWVLMLLVSGRGLGLGCFGQIVQVAAFNTVPDGQMPRATALVNVCQRITTAFSTAVLTSILVIGLTWTSAPAGTSIAAGTAPIADMEQTFRYAFYLMTALSIAGIGLALFLRDKVQEQEQERRRDTPVSESPAEGQAAS
ncbi:MAG TPA: MDR family MFS transporter [Dehalococcoidia bacterium]|nr:MDR family MFS transporter [Dehalococcoidia bacterium]